MEVIRQQICEEVVKHVVILRIPRRRIDVGHSMCPCVFEGNLSVVGEQVSHCPIVNWHSDEPLPIEMVSTIPYAHDVTEFQPKRTLSNSNPNG